MKTSLASTSRLFMRLFLRHAWRTTQQKWTTSFAGGGLLLATFAMPSFGIAVFGTAFAGWGIAVVLFSAFSALVGNRIGVGREKAVLEKAHADQPPARR
ncbi:hypothetical protein [Rhizobium sp. S163]|uniref:hypothetical protein n=1 Tax=Rhizobium sp. S163 TaxID=3055039 RepID=UPI0025A95B79|nr:hypothetical protein [Rhizobium sp. S163]MDM9645795.1 hypothetical protein [Rhizobium sp. S163]